MAGVRVICGAAAVLVAVGQFVHLPLEQRAALWSRAGHLLGVDGVPITKPVEQSRVAPSPIAWQRSPVGGETIEPDRFGQFLTTVEIEGRSVPVVVDTGAYMVSINYDEADRLGYRPFPADFRYRLTTANGIVAYAKVNLREIRLGSIVVRDVEALVAPRGALERGLLGMNFLKKLTSFRTESGRLILQQ